ncbi:carbohydrate kinase family protein [Alkalispirochaeta sphaeroplastigenens]|nr:carbohydrate kinase family protein [Alkalispirochaeta sphaeroplastigenens]
MNVTIAGIGAPYLEYPRKAHHDPARGILGGSVAVALFHAAQLLRPRGIPVSLYGLRGNDSAGNRLVELLSRTSIHWDHFIQTPGETPQARYARDDKSPGEGADPPSQPAGPPELFYTPGVTETFRLKHIPESFYRHSITTFESTGTLAPLLSGLHKAVDRARAAGALTIVHDAPDSFLIPEGTSPGNHSDDSNTRSSCFHAAGGGSEALQPAWTATELLILTETRALALTGRSGASEAAREFLRRGVSAVVIACTGGDILFRSSAGTFQPREESLTTQPLPAYWEPFTGALVASLAEQMDQGKQALDLHQAVRWGIATSEYCRTQGSALASQHRPREKRERIREIFLTLS